MESGSPTRTPTAPPRRPDPGKALLAARRPFDSIAPGPCQLIESDERSIEEELDRQLWIFFFFFDKGNSGCYCVLPYRPPNDVPGLVHLLLAFLLVYARASTVQRLAPSPDRQTVIAQLFQLTPTLLPYWDASAKITVTHN